MPAVPIDLGSELSRSGGLRVSAPWLQLFGCFGWLVLAGCAAAASQSTAHNRTGTHRRIARPGESLPVTTTVLSTAT